MSISVVVVLGFGLVRVRLSKNVRSRSRSAARINGSPRWSRRLASMAIVGRHRPQPGTFDLRHLIGVGDAACPSEPSTAPTARPHNAAPRRAADPPSRRAIRLAAEYAACPRPPQTPDTEEHTRIRASGRSGHSSVSRAKPLILAATVSANAAGLSASCDREGRRPGGVDDQRRTVARHVRGAARTCLGRREIALRGKHFGAMRTCQLRDRGGVDTAAAEQHEAGAPLGRRGTGRSAARPPRCLR